MLCSIWLILIFSINIETRADIFSASAEIGSLLPTQEKITDELRLYIKKEEIRLSVLKKYLNVFQREHEKAMEDIPRYLGSFVNTFTLIKRLTMDINYINYYINTESDINFKNSTSNHSSTLKYPTEEDLIGAVEGIARIQEAYNLDVKELAGGRILGTSYSSPMTASDCYELARTLFKLQNFESSIAWMSEALHKYKDEDRSYPFSVLDIIEFISCGYYFLGDTRNALQWIQKMLDQDPKNIKTKNIFEICKIRNEKENTTFTTKRNLDIFEDSSEKGYYPLCRGEIDVPIAISSRLTCSYWSKTHPFLKLAPFKVEVLYKSPDIILFHDMLSDEEMDSIKRTAKPLLVRSMVHNPKTGQGEKANFRICKSTWLNDTESDTVAHISRRVMLMTGLNMDTAEELQVVNYGIGGHYMSHYDFARSAVRWAGGNRIVTVLFYISDVTLGGATVFPNLGLSIQPRKGAAVFWYNLHASGEGDLATQHASCPVLQGEKWVCSKWLHQGGQEFLKPCNLKYQPEGIADKALRLKGKSSMLRH